MRPVQQGEARHMARPHLRWFGWALLAAMTACGGGGGGDAGQPGAGNPPSSATGLIPTAPTVGNVLQTDASKLRPLVAGASWDYRGTWTAGTGTFPTRYQTTTTLNVVGSGTASEMRSNALNDGSDSSTLTIAGGVIKTPVSIDFAGKGVAETIDFVELRSPVRQGDQYTILDRRYTDTAMDADRDGKPDPLDVAIYVRVVGAETLTLPNLPALETIRADTFVLQRVMSSSTGQFSPTVTASVKTWYARGIGIVRQQSTVPTATGSEVQVFDEQIVAFDGIDTGLGAMAPRQAVIPAQNPEFPGRSLDPASTPRAFAFADHLIVLSRTPCCAGGGMSVNRFDLRGNLLAMRWQQQPNLFSAPGRTAGHAGGVVLSEPVGSSKVALTHLDAQGLQVGAAGGVSIDLGGTRFLPVLQDFALAVDGSTLWVLWRRSYSVVGVGFAHDLVLRPFTLDGVPLAPEMLADDVETTSLALASAKGRVLLSWVRKSPGYDVRYAVATVGGGLGTSTLATGLASAQSWPLPLGLDTGGALLWGSPLGSGVSVGTSGGVRLDAAFQPVRAGTSLDAELIVGMPSYSESRASSLGDRIVVAASKSELLWPEDFNATNVDTVAWLDVTAGPLAGGPVHKVRMPSRLAMAHVQLADRVIAFGSVNSTLATTVVWLNRGHSTGP